MSADAAQSTPSNPIPAIHTPGTGWPARLLLLLIAFVVFAPVIYHEAGPAEAAKWHLGAAREYDLSERDEQALASYEKAIQWHPKLWLTYQERARFFASRNRYDEALADWDQSLECFPLDHRTSIGRRMVTFERGEVLLHLNRYEEALKDAKQLTDTAQGIGERLTALNWIAYLRAVMDRDIETAESEIDEVFQMLEENRLSQDMPLLIDTRAFILYRLGKFEEASKEMDRAVLLQRSASARFLRDDERRRRVLDAREGEREVASEARVLAVMHYHRALIFEALGDEAKAARDFEMVRELGYDPSPALF